jgi:transforming growth factor-beta-induced protein
LSTFTTAVRAANLTSTLRDGGPFTVFAPTNEAFAKLPQPLLTALLKPENRDTLRAILTYHVLQGEVLQANVVRLKSGTQVPTVHGDKVTIQNRLALKVNDATIVRTDILTQNGVIHAIDSVLLPPGLKIDGLTGERPQQDIVEVAKEAGSFKTLLAAVEAAGLTDVLRRKGPFTVFAPTDEAFAKLPKATLTKLLQPENREMLKEILTYHVLPKEVLAERIVRLGDSVGVSNTVNGAEVRLRNTRNGVFVNDSKVLKTDIRTQNGVIHVIDTVLIPSDMRI